MKSFGVLLVGGTNVGVVAGSINDGGGGLFVLPIQRELSTVSFSAVKGDNGAMLQTNTLETFCKQTNTRMERTYYLRGVTK